MCPSAGRVLAGSGGHAPYCSTAVINSSKRSVSSSQAHLGGDSCYLLYVFPPWDHSGALSPSSSCAPSPRISRGVNSPCCSAQQCLAGRWRESHCLAPCCLHTWKLRLNPGPSPLCFLLSPCRAGAVGGRASADCKEISLMPCPISCSPTCDCMGLVNLSPSLWLGTGWGAWRGWQNTSALPRTGSGAASLVARLRFFPALQFRKTR